MGHAVEPYWGCWLHSLRIDAQPQWHHIQAMLMLTILILAPAPNCWTWPQPACSACNSVAAPPGWLHNAIR